MSIMADRPAPLCPAIGSNVPAMAADGSVVGWPALSSAQPMGMASPFSRAR